MREDSLWDIECQVYWPESAKESKRTFFVAADTAMHAAIAAHAAIQILEDDECERIMTITSIAQSGYPCYTFVKE